MYCCSCLVCIFVILCVFFVLCVHCCVFFFLKKKTLGAGLLARSQYSEGPATSHLDTGFSWIPCVHMQMLRWSPRFQVATTCFSCSPPDLNSVVTNFMFCIHVKQPLPLGYNPIAVNYYYYYYYINKKHIAKAFKDTKLKITLKTNNTTAKLLKYKNEDDQIKLYNNSVHQVTYSDWR